MFTLNRTGYRVVAATLALLLLMSSAFAQSVETEPAVDRSRILFIDTPVRLSADVMASTEIVGNVAGSAEDAGQADLTLDTEQDFSTVRRLESISRYMETVESIENRGGAWDQGLVQELSAMGGLLQQQGAHLEAIDSFERAVYLNRINSGLYTLEQTPVIGNMIASYIALGNWEQADIYNNYLFHVQQKAYGYTDPRIIPAIERLANWHIRAFNVGHGEFLGVRLSSAQILFNAAARMVGTHFGRSDERFVSYLRRSANSAYLASQHLDLMAEVDRPAVRTSQERLREQLNEDRPAVSRGYQAGELALREIIKFQVELGDSPYALAEAITYLGDWYLLFGRRYAAVQQYQAAWEILQSEENGKALSQQLFGQVTPLPTFADDLAEAQGGDTALPGEDNGLHFDFADLLFDVLETGVVRNIQILTEETEENARQLSRLRRAVRNSKFRPIMREGETERSTENHFRYRYWY